MFRFCLPIDKALERGGERDVHAVQGRIVAWMVRNGKICPKFVEIISNPAGSLQPERNKES